MHPDHESARAGFFWRLALAQEAALVPLRRHNYYEQARTRARTVRSINRDIKLGPRSAWPVVGRIRHKIRNATPVWQMPFINGPRGASRVQPLYVHSPRLSFARRRLLIICEITCGLVVRFDRRFFYSPLAWNIYFNLYFNIHEFVKLIVQASRLLFILASGGGKSFHGKYSIGLIVVGLWISVKGKFCNFSNWRTIV